MSKHLKFNCTACGLCCVVSVASGLPPEWDRGDGYCKHLQPDMSCGIYEARPLLCRVDDSWAKSRKRIKRKYGVRSKPEFHALLEHGCRTLQEVGYQGDPALKDADDGVQGQQELQASEVAEGEVSDRGAQVERADSDAVRRA